jgi:hypothetical protein
MLAMQKVSERLLIHFNFDAILHRREAGKSVSHSRTHTNLVAHLNRRVFSYGCVSPVAWSIW